MIMSKASSIKPINVSIYQNHFLPAEVNGSRFFLVHWTIKVISLIKDQDFFIGLGGNYSEISGRIDGIFSIWFLHGLKTNVYNYSSSSYSIIFQVLPKKENKKSLAEIFSWSGYLVTYVSIDKTLKL